MATVAPVLLHTPHRIAALGLVLMLALMVRNYIQFTIRRRLVETGSTVPDRLGKPTQSPTTETALIPFASIAIVHILVGHTRVDRQITGLNEHVSTVLRMLGLDENVFTEPPRRKIEMGSRRNQGM